MSTEDQVTVPLAALRIAADRLCNVICIDPWTDEVLAGGHDVACLQPLLAEAKPAKGERPYFRSARG